VALPGKETERTARKIKIPDFNKKRVPGIVLPPEKILMPIIYPYYTGCKNKTADKCIYPYSSAVIYRLIKGILISVHPERGKFWMGLSAVSDQIAKSLSLMPFAEC
jgi:hypothetical protein